MKKDEEYAFCHPSLVHLSACCQQENKLLSNTSFFPFPHSFLLLFPILTWCEALQWWSPQQLSSLPYLDLHYVQLGELYFKAAIWRDLTTSSRLHASNKIWQIPGPMRWWHILSFQWVFPIQITTASQVPTRHQKWRKNEFLFCPRQWVGLLYDKL